MSRSTASAPGLTESGMTHRQVMQALSGLLLGMFVSMLATTVVGTSLPLIISDLKGDQSAFTWVVTATLLATTVSTPIWGKLADLMNRKLLLQLALVIFVVSSAIAGFAQDPASLITMRVFQGIGAGGLGALSQIVMADILSPRERGKYAGLFGAVMAVATVGGPLLGGVITDSLGWRWNFFVGLPIAVVALVLLQRTLHLPAKPKRKVSIDYFGIVLISSGVSLLLIWVSLAGSQFEWNSPTTYLMVGGAVVLLALAIVAEMKATEPLIPLGLFRDRTFTLAVVASVSVGVAMFGTAVFLSQYMQLARGATPTESGLLTIPMMAGLLIASTVIGNLVSRRGKWKMYVVIGSVLMIAGSFLLSRLHYDTPFLYVGISMFVLGAGVGMLMQNLVIVVQNKVELKNLGVATSAVTFFRSLGGTVGVSVMGSILGTVVAENIKSGIGGLPPEQQAEAAKALAGGAIPQIAQLPDFLRVVVESAYGTGVGAVFLAAVPLAIVTLLAVVFLPNAQLGTLNAVDRAKVEGDTPREEVLEEGAENLVEVAEGSVGIPLTGSVPTFGRNPGDGRS
ncbi:DHA2 family efflux MFS transporter permease subunit [Agromyces atrinae]|uniref:DHA2 family efflux MFS transporter permease subunit n=1 Tax=Agromyces atrinae TaxID=592376 RepID=UPI001F596F50|nr:DHA2 family efflux MFS transporter permease subunit [Agromyces atrinae]MCI2957481.1 DHA2 family efflux MFS transporter permease subunit [Agromyces atrinae]